MEEVLEAQGIETSRIIGEYGEGLKGPTIVFFGGIHGNEPSGVFALQKVMKTLEQQRVDLPNKIIAISGNREALRENKRYIHQDLNRIWPEEINIHAYSDKPANDTVSEHKERDELHEQVNNIIASSKGPYYFFDLHTVSSETIPFIVINDMLINRNMALKFPVPTILGIEEFVAGTLLNYINSLGHLAIGFESGNHTDRKSVARHISFIWCVLVFSESISSSQVPDFQFHLDNLSGMSNANKSIYEVKHRYRIADEESFTMKPNYANFQTIKTGEPLADSSRKGIIEAKDDGLIFMPLYQSQGADGFFIIQPMPRIALWASTFLRKIRFENLLVLLPGIKRDEEMRNVLIVNTKIARFLANELFHLLGFRRVHKIKNHLLFTRREHHN